MKQAFFCQKIERRFQTPKTPDEYIRQKKGEKTMISRRDFLRYCGISAAALGLSSLDLLNLKEALANPRRALCHLASGEQLLRVVRYHF